jgi:hypothetical protein
MDRILSFGLSKEFPNSARGGFRRIGGSDHGSEMIDGVRSLEYDWQAGSTGHELHQIGVKGPSLVDRIEGSCFGSRQSNHSSGPGNEAGLLQVGQNRSRFAARDGIWFDDCERQSRCHNTSFIVC